MKVSEKTKIVLFHCSFVYSGGGERIVLEQARGLRDRGYDVEVYAPNVQPEACFPDLMNKVGVRTIFPRLPKWFPIRDGLMMIGTSLLAPLAAFRFRSADLFLGCNQPGAWLAFIYAKLLKKPYLVYLNQPNRLLYPRPIDRQTGWQNRRDYYWLAIIIRLVKPLIVWLDRVSFTRAEAMMVNGRYIGRTIEKIYGRETVEVPAAGYYQPEHKLRLKPNAAFRGGFRVNRRVVKKPYLLITNRHEPQKRFDYVISAFKKVLKTFPDCRLVIPGPFTDHTPTLVALTKKLGVEKQVVWPGTVTEVQLQNLYAQSAVHCYPSPDEDFGLGPVEAGGWGVPTVAWNHGGPTVTVKNGVTGFLAKPYEVDDYAAQILALLENREKRAKMGKAAWGRTKAKFSWEVHLDAIEKEVQKAR